jgi:hypothetical protein
MCLKAVDSFLRKANESWSLIESLIHKNILKEVEYSGNKFLVKNIKNKIDA